MAPANDGLSTPPVSPRNELPVDAVVPDVVAAARQGNVVVTAPPGSGKTTRIPPALRALGRVLVLEPRRIATRMAASRVAAEMGVEVGTRVGYQVRFEVRGSPDTGIMFVTEGVLTRRLLDDPVLRGVDVVVLDEFHERHLQADVALAWLRDLQLTRRPDLRLVAMSATLDTAPLARYLGDCPVVQAAGRLHAVDIVYEADTVERPLEARVAAAVRRAFDREPSGDVLVFLPGAAEIARCASSCAGVAALHGAAIRRLHGDMPLDEQQEAIRPGPQRKLILSTNVAESSVTVEGVTTVIDSGLARQASTSPWSGLDEVRLEKISRASAEQRAGRAGRVRPGRCVRLYGQHDFERRAAHEVAELHRVDLSETALLLHGAGFERIEALPWYEMPSEAAVAQAEALLERLGALAEGRLTPTGRAMLPLAVHPRLARMGVEGAARGVGREAAAAAALLSEREIRRGVRDSSARRADVGVGLSDVTRMLDAFHDATSRGGPEYDMGAVQAVRRVQSRLQRALGGVPRGPAGDGETALLQSLLMGWPDRVARRRVRDGRPELLLSGGGTARLADTSVVRDSEWMVCVDAEQRGGTPLVRVASAIEAGWLLDHFIDRVTETDERVWNDKVERVEVLRRIWYDRLVLDESRVRAPADAASADLLAAAAVRAGLSSFVDLAVPDRFLQRLAFVARVFPEDGWPALGEEALNAALRRLCEGVSSFAEVRMRASEGGLLTALRQGLTGEQLRRLERAAPESVALGGRRKLTVHYPPQQDPWIASRLQDFFGMRDGPRVGEGRVALVLHLLAPNQRPVQVTTDLAGFWVRTYPQVRRELSRRYPRHAWPENP